MTPPNNLMSPARITDLSRIEDLTRREFMASALAGALLIACGDEDDDKPEEQRFIDFAFRDMSARSRQPQACRHH